MLDGSQPPGARFRFGLEEMGQIVTIGLESPKVMFSGARGGCGRRHIIQQKLTRSRLLPFFGNPGTLSGRGSARELIELGQDVRLIPPSYMKPYVKRQKNDMTDAAVIYKVVHLARQCASSGESPSSGGSWVERLVLSVRHPLAPVSGWSPGEQYRLQPPVLSGA